MGIEIVFFGILVIFAVTGLVHGYKQELGVTVVLLLAVCLLELTESTFRGEFNRLLGVSLYRGPVYREATRGLFYCAILLLTVFVAYQTEYLKFPGAERSFTLSLGSGVFNGYLLAGSLWYYLAQGGWPLLPTLGAYSEVYRVAWNLLPPNVLSWPILFAGAIGMIVIRTIK